MGFFARTGTAVLIIAVLATVYGNDIKQKFTETKEKAYYAIHPEERKKLYIRDIREELEGLETVFSQRLTDETLDEGTKTALSDAVKKVNNSKDALQELERLETEPTFAEKTANVISKIVGKKGSDAVCEPPKETWKPESDDVEK